MNCYEFEDIEFPDGLESVCNRDHNCGDPIERLYYSAEYDAICYYCASENVTSKVPPDVYPLCITALVKKMLRREVNKTHLMANLWSCIHFIVLCTELSLL